MLGSATRRDSRRKAAIPRIEANLKRAIADLHYEERRKDVDSDTREKRVKESKRRFEAQKKNLDNTVANLGKGSQAMNLGKSKKKAPALTIDVL